MQLVFVPTTLWMKIVGLFLFFVFLGRISLYNPDWPGDQAGIKLAEIHLPLPTGIEDMCHHTHHYTLFLAKFHTFSLTVVVIYSEIVRSVCLGQVCKIVISLSLPELSCG